MLVFLGFFARLAWAAYVVDRVRSTVVRSAEMSFARHEAPGRLRVFYRELLPKFELLHSETFNVAFNPVTDFNVFYFEDFNGDLGAELLRFRGLRRIAVEELSKPVPNERQWRKLCTALRSMENLEELELAGNELTDDALAPLRGHPHLKSVWLPVAHVTGECANIFATMPCLKFLEIDNTIYSGDAWLTEDEKKEFQKRLPKTEIVFP